MEYRFATLDDVPTLAGLNRQLVEDEQHRNRVRSASWFAQRMHGFLTGGYQAVLFERDGKMVAYALYTDHPEHADTIYLRHIFVQRSCRRQGIGREAIRILSEDVWPREKRITVGVLAGNQIAIAFYEAVGFKPYSAELELPAAQRNTSS